MNRNLNFTDTSNKNQTAAFKEKVYVIADEVLSVLKELHQEHAKQIDSKLIAEKMSRRNLIMKVLVEKESINELDGAEMDTMQETVNMVLDRFSDIVPSSLLGNLGDLKDKIHSKSDSGDSAQWLDPAVKIVKKYIGSLTDRIKNLKDLFQKTMHYLTETEKHLSFGLSSAQENFQENRNFEKSLYSNMDEMRQSINAGDINTIKSAVLSRIENINRTIETNRDQDIKRLKETETTIEEMGKKMNDLKNEAEETRKRSEELEFETVRDNLTGLYNRKAYNLKIKETMANMERYEVPASLLVCDLDYFKKINDTFGHHVGDLTIKKVAGILTKRLRKNDFIARYGGEEFVAILPHTHLDKAIRIAEGLQSYINASVFIFKEKNVPVTISIGVSTFKKGDDAINIFERADSALYMAKDSGRNNIKTENDVKYKVTGSTPDMGHNNQNIK